MTGLIKAIIGNISFSNDLSRRFKKVAQGSGFRVQGKALKEIKFLIISLINGNIEVKCVLSPINNV